MQTFKISGESHAPKATINLNWNYFNFPRFISDVYQTHLSTENISEVNVENACEEVQIFLTP